jgi:hypothetical protein
MPPRDITVDAHEWLAALDYPEEENWIDPDIVRELAADADRMNRALLRIWELAIAAEDKRSPTLIEICYACSAALYPDDYEEWHFRDCGIAGGLPHKASDHV